MDGIFWGISLKETRLFEKNHGGKMPVFVVVVDSEILVCDMDSIPIKVLIL